MGSGEKPRHAMPHRTMLCHAMLRQAVSHRAVPRRGQAAA
jgi:hypothetical protein